MLGGPVALDSKTIPVAAPTEQPPLVEQPKEEEQKQPVAEE